MASTGVHQPHVKRWHNWGLSSTGVGAARPKTDELTLSVCSWSSSVLEDWSSVFSCASSSFSCCWVCQHTPSLSSSSTLSLSSSSSSSWPSSTPASLSQSCHHCRLWHHHQLIHSSPTPKIPALQSPQLHHSSILAFPHSGIAEAHESRTPGWIPAEGQGQAAVIVKMYKKTSAANKHKNKLSVDKNVLKRVLNCCKRTAAAVMQYKLHITLYKLVNSPYQTLHILGQILDKINCQYHVFEYVKGVWFFNDCTIMGNLQRANSTARQRRCSV